MTKDELIEKTDKAISELVYSKYDLQKAYNYYNGIRDADQFRYLEEVYGTNTPTTLHFTPLIKKHIDALIGEYLGTPIVPKIFCKDNDTISNIDREKQLKVAFELQKYLKGHLNNSILNFINGKPMSDGLVQEQLKRIVEDINNSFIDLQENIRRKVRSLRNKSWDAELRSHKPLRQQEEDNFNVKKIINLLTSATSKDHLIIAKIMLINILRNINESKKVVELNAPNFESLKNYIYSGNTNSVYAMDSNSVEAKDGMYIFNSGKAKVYKNPRDLLNAAGINVDELTVDVMKGLKKELKAQAEKGANLADEYKKAEQELLGIIQKIVQPNASVVSEDIKTLIGKGKDFLLDKARKKQTPEQATEKKPEQKPEQVTKQNTEQAVEQKPEQTQQTQTNQLENYVKEIGLPDDYDPKGTTVKSVILRQTFKGYILLKKDNKWYVGNYKDLDNIKKVLQPQQSSVVTSGAADSTYGNGYNYNKEADAIKKKLNCTTYTYSPNSKMKIVRRTFD